jgi:hypothetical protein
MVNFVDDLVAMGFDQKKAQRAVNKTGGGSVQNALDWLLQHADDPSDEDDEEMPQEPVKEKLVLTQEQKDKQRTMLEERIKAKRAEKEANKSKDSIEKEKARRLQGQEAVEAAKLHKEKAMQKMLDERKRQRQEDAIAKKKVQDQLRADREARKAEREKGKAPEAATLPEPVKAVSSAPAKKHDACRIQFRFPRGPPVVGTFTPTSTVADALDYLRQHRSDGFTGESYFIAFRKQYGVAEGALTLEECKLVPSAAVVVKDIQ